MAAGTSVTTRKRLSAAESSSVLAQLRSFIEHGRYSSGARLPAERVLAAQLRVGRPAIREAIKALSILDVLESRRGDGTYVKSLAALHADWPAVVEVAESDLNMLELLEVRKIMEPKAAALAATRASEHELREIVEVKSALEAEFNDWHKIGRLDFALHAAIIKSSGNSMLNGVHRYLTPFLLKSRDITARSVADWTRMHNDHRAIVEAICRGESAAAEQAMLEHMHHVGLDLISNRKR
jgi:GntR family transcriptional regulator, transcriptional repressor for pyruvate dehydrogenase complex